MGDGAEGQMASGGEVERRHHPADSRTVIALAERMAVVETQQHQLIQDSATIRRSLHDINNQVTVFIGSLASLQRLAEDFPKLSEMVAVFNDERQRRRGAWGAAVLFGTMLMGAVTLGGAIVAMFTYFSHR